MVKSCLHQAIILNQPQSQTVALSSDATFSVYAMSGPPFSTNGVSYQWQFNGTILSGTNHFFDIPGATQSSITITNVSTNEVGFYRVLVSGSSTVASDPAALQAFATADGQIPILYGTPIASGGSKLSCPGAFISYVPYVNNWNWYVFNPNAAVTAIDGRGRSDSKAEYNGYYGDRNCKPTPQGAVSTGNPPLSPRYQFTLYFSQTPNPTGSYPLNVTNLH